MSLLPVWAAIASAQIEDLRQRQQTFGQDFASNILGNAAWDGALWLLGKLFKR